MQQASLLVLGQLVVVPCQHGAAHHLAHFPAGLGQAGAIDFESPNARFPVHRQRGGQVSLELEGGSFDMLLVAAGRKEDTRRLG